MLTKFAELAERIKDQIALGAEPKDCKTAAEPKDCKTAHDLIEVLLRWTSTNCPIVQPVEIIADPVEK